MLPIENASYQPYRFQETAHLLPQEALFERLVHQRQSLEQASRL